MHNVREPLLTYYVAGIPIPFGEYPMAIKFDLRAIYSFYPLSHTEPGLPSGAQVYYECECGDVVSSVSFIKTACSCGNVQGDKGAAQVTDKAKVKPVKGVLK